MRAKARELLDEYKREEGTGRARTKMKIKGEVPREPDGHGDLGVC